MGVFNKTKPYENLGIIIILRAKIDTYSYFILHLEGKILKCLITTQYEFASY